MICAKHTRSQAPAWERTVLEALPPADDDQTTIRRQSLQFIGFPRRAWEPDGGVHRGVSKRTGFLVCGQWLAEGLG